ncbi:sugar ABC transporter substrate-binding protein [Paenibacillus sp. CCS19]|uniref:extracellular solute-binding protein n=1 Tax=Paenibacillus sp. CCS19 TaxID=3158387 RepID=UPI00256ADF24|nr:extracellular solute-binding protein [Paenibacillus cellulosilyticus]GMK37869.1 sugar ABC transporter substrate-binding protein [Paenibacillus cellulosilyticus]
MKTWKKLLTTALMFTLVVSLLAACGKSDSKSSSEAASASGEGAAASEEPVELTYLTTGDLVAAPLVKDDRIIAEINKRLGIKLNVKVVPYGANDQVIAAFASGDYPDVVTTNYPTQAVSQWIDEGILVPINDYLDEMPTVKQKLENLQWTAIDGKYYGYLYQVGGEHSNYTLVYRQDWLDKLNLKLPTTLDDLHNVLKAFATQDPDGNGKADTYGLTTTKPGAGSRISTFDFAFYAYGLPYADYELDAQGNVIPRFEHPAFKQGIEYLKQLNEEKLIDPEFLVNDNGGKEQKFYQQKAGVMDDALFRNVSRIEGSLKAVNPDGVLGWTAPPVGPEGKGGMWTVPKGGLLTGVTKEAKNKEKAAKFIEFILSPEGRDLLQLGIEGIHYTKNGDAITYNEEERAKDGFAKNGWSHPLAWGNVIYPLDASYLPQTEPNRDRAIQSVEISSKTQIPNLVPTIGPAELKNSPIVNEIYNQYFLDMINGKIDIDKGIEELGKKWRQQGGDEILKEITEAYNKTK